MTRLTPLSPSARHSLEQSAVASDYPTVLFVDDDPDALNSILVDIEPRITSYSLRTAGSMSEYIKKIRPEIVVVSDRLTHEEKGAFELVSELRTQYRGRIVVLTECIDLEERERWQETGVDACVLHPTRLKDRLRDLSQTILNLTAGERNDHEKEGDGLQGRGGDGR